MSDRFRTFCHSFKPSQNLSGFQLLGGGMRTGPLDMCLSRLNKIIDLKARTYVG
jgi:hypothetical protein